MGIPVNLVGMLLDSDMVPAGFEKKIQASEDQYEKARKRSISGISSEIVDFVYDQKSIRDLLNEYAEKLGINILYPETETITAKVTFDAGRKLTVAEAWDFVKMILEQAGYTLVLRVPGVYAIIHNSKAFTEPLPLYIGVDFNQLPDSMERIRYVYYFGNISATKQKGELTTIITNILGPQDIKNTCIFEDSSNSIILTTRADMIKAVMQLLVVLDEGGFQQSVEILKLEHALAKDVTELFGQIIGGGANKAAGFVSTAATPRSRYFSEMTKVINLDAENARHLNSVVIIGKPTDIEEVIKFIKKYLDIPQESGKSFFHVVELQWLQAVDFATVLQTLTAAGSGGGTAQSTGSIISDIGFDPHIKIVAEATQTTSNAGVSNQSGQSGQSSNTNSGQIAGITGIQNTGQRGANKLIIACSSRDWERIKVLIEQIDVPQKQVIIEAIVMDLSVEFVRGLGAQMRTQGIATSIFPKNMQAQAGLVVQNILGNVGTSANQGDPNYYNLVGDLSDILNPGGLASAGGGSLIQPNATTLGPGVPSAAPSTFNGSALGLISGGKARTDGAWAFFQLISTHNASKVFTRPVTMALNNQPVTVTGQIYKNLISNVVTGTNPTINYTQEPATVKINFTPLISDNNAINLQVILNLTLWLLPDNVLSGTKLTRALTTNVSMKSGDVLVLGGLLSEQAQLSKTSVPFFERIPIIGNLFASRSKSSTKSRLFVVIRATTVEPRMQGGMNSATKAAANYMIDQLAETEETFATLKDPITRWFFNSDSETTPSEYFEHKVTNLSTIDYGQKENEVAHEHPIPWHEKIAQQGGNMRLGWLSGVKDDNEFASGPANDVEMDKLAKLLQSVNNPFETRLNV